MNDRPLDAFEDRLRSGLAGLRPPAAPASLAGRVNAIPATRQVGFWRRVAAGSGAWLTTGAIAALAVVGLAYLADRGLIIGDPGGGPDATPSTAGFDPAIEGPGILRGAAPLLQVVPLTAAVIVLLLGMRWALRWRWHNLAIRGVGVLIAATALASPAAIPGFEQGSAIAPTLGYDYRVDAAPGSNGLDTWYTTAGPGEPTIAFMTIRNPGPLPIRLEGLVETHTNETPLIPRWIAMWLAPPGDCCSTPLSRLTPFEPTTVEPGEQLPIYLVGRAGLCAYGPGYTLDAPVNGWSTRDSQLRLVYSVFGLTAEASVAMGMNLVEPYREGCSG